MRRSAFLLASSILIGAVAGTVLLLLRPEGGGGRSSCRPALAVPSSDEPGRAPAAVEELRGEPPSSSSPRTPASAAEPGILVRGRVIGRDGSPAPAGTLVRLLPRSEESAPPTTESDGEGELPVLFAEGAWRNWDAAVRGGTEPAHLARSRDGGAFEIEVPRSIPSFRLDATAEFGRAQPVEWHRPHGAEVAAGLTLVLEPAGKVEGSLRGPDGTAPRGGGVILQGKFDEILQQRCDASGRFEFRGVPAGTYVAVGWGEGLGSEYRANLDVRAGEATRLELVLPRESWISGLAVDEEGRGMSGALVVARCRQEAVSDVGPPSPRRRARTDERGAFRIGSLAGGRYLLDVESPGPPQSRLEEVEVPRASGSEGVRIVLPKGGSIAGRLVDAETRPVDGAVVWAEAGRWSHRRCTTGVDGTFRLTGLSDGPFCVRAAVEGAGSATCEEVQTGTGDLLLVLRPSGIAGTVRGGESGAPVARFTLEEWVDRRDDPWNPGLQIRRARSFEGPDGAFEWIDLPPGPAILAVHAPGFVATRLGRIEVKAGEVTRGLEVRLRRAAELRGRVLAGDSGKPVPGAKVRWLEPDTDRATLDDGGTVTTGADGGFLLAGLPPGRLRIEVDRDEFLPATVEPVEVREGEKAEDLVVRLEPAGAVEGVAFAPDGSEFVRGKVVARHGDSDNRPWAWIEPQGRFRIPGVQPGKYRIWAGPAAETSPGPDPQPVLRTVAFVEAGRTTQVEFGDPPSGPCTVKGKVLRAGEPVARASVWLVPAPRGADPDLLEMFRDRFACLTAADGSYSIPRVPAGDATLWVESSSRPLVVPEAEELTVDVSLTPTPSGAIEGTVTRAWDGRPVEGAWVDVRSTRNGTFASHATTKEGGLYRVEELAPGSYRVEVEEWTWLGTGESQPASLFAESTTGPIVLGEGEVARVDLVLRQAGIARAVVADPEGRGEGGALVVFRRMDLDEASSARSPMGTCDEKGVATCAGLAAGRYVALACADGFAWSSSEERTVREGEVAEFAVRLVKGAVVKVRILGDPAALPLSPGAHFRDAQGWETWARRDDRRSGKVEAFAQARLAPGEYTLFVGSPGYRDTAVPVRIGADSPQEVVVRLEPEAEPK